MKPKALLARSFRTHPFNVRILSVYDAGELFISFSVVTSFLSMSQSFRAREK